MRIIQEHNKTALKIAKPHCGALPPFRKYTYSDECKVNDGLLLFNLVTSEVLLLEKCDFAAEAVPNSLDIAALTVPCRDYLLSHRFIVSEANKDFRDVDKLREIRKLLDEVNFNGFTSYTILTTTDCNARCYYCYEKGITKIFMDEQTASDTADFILKNCARTGEKAVRLSWFGGEPLYNDRVIDIISCRLAEVGIDYSSSMISNGLLLDAEKRKKAVELWKLNRIQISLDGTEKIYNRTKAYIGGVENAYETVMANIGSALNAGIRVNIRLNVSKSNIEDLYRLAEELAERFPRKKPKVYGNILIQYNTAERDGDREALEEKSRKLHEKLKALGLAAEAEDSGEDSSAEKGGVRLYKCMADNPRSVVILPDGKLHSCDQLEASRVWGSIYSETDKYTAHFLSDSADGTQSPIEYWSECDARDECRRCQVYPFCVRLLHCPNRTEGCDSELKERILLKLKKSRRHFMKEVTR